MWLPVAPVTLTYRKHFLLREEASTALLQGAVTCVSQQRYMTALPLAAARSCIAVMPASRRAADWRMHTTQA